MTTEIYADEDVVHSAVAWHPLPGHEITGYVVGTVETPDGLTLYVSIGRDLVLRLDDAHKVERVTAGFPCVGDHVLIICKTDGTLEALISPEPWPTNTGDSA